MPIRFNRPHSPRGRQTLPLPARTRPLAEQSLPAFCMRLTASQLSLNITPVGPVSSWREAPGQ